MASSKGGKKKVAKGFAVTQDHMEAAAKSALVRKRNQNSGTKLGLSKTA